MFTQQHDDDYKYIVVNFAAMWSFFSRDPTKDFAYEIGEKVSGLEDRSLWILHQGKRKVSADVFVGVAYCGIRVHFHVVKYYA